MIYILPIIFIFLLIHGPQLWVIHVLKKHHKQIEGMLGTGGELANHLVERFKLIGVKVEEGKSDQDFYSPDRNVISLSPEVFQGKSESMPYWVNNKISICYIGNKSFLIKLSVFR